MRLSPPRLRALAPYAAAVVWLVLAWLWLVRGAAHPGVPYRPWAFDHHAYSDLLAMGGDRYFHGGRPVPYAADPIEYPPLLGLLVWGASFAPGGPAGYFTAGFLVLALACLASIRLLSRIPGAEPWWWAASPALLYFSGLNWDHLPIALLLAAVWAEARGRSAGAGGLCALGAAAKLLPVAMVPAAAGAAAGAGRRRALGVAALAFAGTWLAVNLPVAAWAPEGWARFWRFNAGRAAENSAWEALRHLPALAPLAADAAFLGRATALLVAAAAAFSALGAFRAATAPEARALRLGTAFVLVFWVAVNKVWSPQYLLYAFAAGALAGAPWRWFWPLAAATVVDYHLAFEVRASRPLLAWHGPLYVAEELARTGLLLAFALSLARSLWRAGSAAPPGPPPPAGGAG